MQMRLAKLAALGLVAAAALTPAALAITPDSQVDQSQTVTEGCLTVTPALIVGQVFTAGVSGRLSDVVLTLGNTTAAVGSLHVGLTRTDGLGHPDRPPRSPASICPPRLCRRQAPAASTCSSAIRL